MTSTFFSYVSHDPEMKQK